MMTEYLSHVDPKISPWLHVCRFCEMGGGGWFCFPVVISCGSEWRCVQATQISWVVTLQRHRAYQIVVRANAGPEHPSF